MHSFLLLCLFLLRCLWSYKLTIIRFPMTACRTVLLLLYYPLVLNLIFSGCFFTVPLGIIYMYKTGSSWQTYLVCHVNFTVFCWGDSFVLHTVMLCVAYRYGTIMLYDASHFQSTVSDRLTCINSCQSVSQCHTLSTESLIASAMLYHFFRMYSVS